MYPRSALKLGSTQVTMLSLRAWGFDYPPCTSFQPYALVLDERTGTGKRVRRGLPRARWSFAELTPTQMEVFDSLLHEKGSYPVYVTTLEDDGETYATYYVLMHVTERTWSSGWKWTDVTIEFTRMEAV